MKLFTILLCIIGLSISLNGCISSKEASNSSVKLKITEPVQQVGDTLKVNWKPDEIAEIEKRTKKDSVGEKVDNTGSFKLQALKNEKFFLHFTLKDGRTYTRRIDIKAEPIYFSISAPDTANDEKPIILNWTAKNAVRVSIAGISDSLPLTGSHELSLSNSAKIKCYAINKAGQIKEENIEVKVRNIDHIQLKDKYFVGEFVTIKWLFKNTMNVEIPQYSDYIFNDKDSISFEARKTQKIPLYVKRKNGKKDTVILHINCIKPIIESFTVTPVVKINTASIVSWKCNASVAYVKLRGKDTKYYPREGSIVIHPTKEIEFKLEAYTKDSILADDQNKKMTVFDMRAFLTGSKNISNLEPSMRIDYDIIGVDRSHFPDSITLKVIAVDTSGNFIEGLAAKASNLKDYKWFKTVTEVCNGKSNSINTFTVREKKISPNINKLALCLDNSGSMHNSYKILDKSCLSFIKNKSDSDYLSLVKFDSNILLLSKLQQNKSILKSAYSSIEFNQLGTGTALYASCDIAMRSLGIKTDTSDSFRNKRLDTLNYPKKMIVFTDGYENSSSLYPNTCNLGISVVKMARENDIKIISIGYGYVNDPVLYGLAYYTDSYYYKIYTSSDIIKVFNEIPKLDMQYYEVVYKPIKTEGIHKVKLNCFNQLNIMQADTAHYFIGKDYKLPELANDPYTVYVDSVIHTLKISDSTGYHIPTRCSLAVTMALFDFDKAELDSIKNKAILQRLVSIMKSDTSYHVIIVGHSDLRGSQKYATLIGTHRANALHNYLIENGIDYKRINTYSVGQLFPTNKKEQTEILARENRKVDIILIK